jgi:hypothetical protein
VLALLFLLHRENGDFSILMKDIKFFDCFSVNLSLGKCPLFALGAVHLCIAFGW